MIDRMKKERENGSIVFITLISDDHSANLRHIEFTKFIMMSSLYVIRSYPVLTLLSRSRLPGRRTRHALARYERDHDSEMAYCV